MDQRASDVRHDIEHTRTALADKIEILDEEVRSKVEDVKNSVDLSYQVQQRPWPMLAASVAVGFLFERMLSGDSASTRAERRRQTFMPDPMYPVYVERKGEHSADPAGTVSKASESTKSTGNKDRVQETHAQPKPQERTSSAPPQKQDSNTGMLGHVMEQFKGELHTIKGMAVGAVTGLVHDMIKQNTPAASSFVKQALNTASTKLTGRGIPEAPSDTQASQNQEEEGQVKQQDPQTTEFAASAYTRPPSLREGRS